MKRILITFLLGFSLLSAQEEGDPLPPLLPEHLLPDLLSNENRARLTSSESMQQRAQHNMDVWKSHRFPWLPIIGLTVLGASLFLARYVRKHAVKSVETEEERKKRLQHEALQVVQALDVSSLPPHDLYDKLSHTVRNYLGVIYHLPAETQSTEDFLEGLFAISALPKERHIVLASFLLKADEIEFGDYQPSLNERSEAIAIARSFVCISAS